MSAPSLPSGYDETRRVQAGRSDCHITVGFDRERAYIPRFILQLHYQVVADPVRWAVIARMDHNETSLHGHDVYKEGLHVDIRRRSASTVHLKIRHSPLSPSRGQVIRRCAAYLKQHAGYFVDVYEERQPPGTAPPWTPDGGATTPMLITPQRLSEGMSREAPVDDALSLEELSELLAEVEGTTPEEIERGAEELEIAPPWEAEVVDE